MEAIPPHRVHLSQLAGPGGPQASVRTSAHVTDQFQWIRRFAERPPLTAVFGLGKSPHHSLFIRQQWNRKSRIRHCLCLEKTFQAFRGRHGVIIQNPPVAASFSRFQEMVLRRPKSSAASAVGFHG
jgi:hypothetical protein